MKKVHLLFALVLLALASSAKTEPFNREVIRSRLREARQRNTLKDYMRETTVEGSTTEIPMLDLRETEALHLLNSEGLKLRQNQKMQFLLPENPSTGFTWQLDTGASNGLWAAEEEYSESNVVPGRRLVGAPGVKKITLTTGDQLGRSMFRAVYARPWEFKGFGADDFDSSTFTENNKAIF